MIIFLYLLFIFYPLCTSKFIFHCMIMFLYAGSIPCANIFTDPNAVIVNMVKTTSRVILTFICQDGYYYVGGSSWQKVTCSFTSGQWSSTLSVCVGKYHLLLVT